MEPVFSHPHTARALGDGQFMKRRILSSWGIFLAVAACHVAVLPVVAQDGPIILPPPPPSTVVTVTTLDAVATEPREADPTLGYLHTPDPAMFAVHRSENLHIDLTVYYRLEGSADNGVDYVELSGSVVIPAGERSTRIPVLPLADDIEELVEEVRITIVPPLCIAIFPPPPECYMVGRPDTAAAFIRDNEGVPVNRPPQVEIVRPASGDVFTLGEDILVEAVTRDVDGYAPRVALYADGVRVDEASVEFFVAPPPGEPIHFELKWESASPGWHVLQVKAYDNEGAEGWSEPIRVAVEVVVDVPVVNVVATDPEAAEPDPVPDGMGKPILLDIGTFTVSRKGGNHEDPLSVYFLVRGTASNGTDYEPIPWFVTIPAGAAEARIEVLPIDDDLPEGKETVELMLIQPPFLAPTLTVEGALPIYFPLLTYHIGPHDRDTVVIVDNDTGRDLPPRVTILRPETGSMFVAPATVDLVAQGIDLDGEVLEVEFFANGESLGMGVPQRDAGGGVFIDAKLFRLTWDNVAVGAYRITAVGTDDDGLQGESDPVHIKVAEEPPPPTDTPVVRINARDPIGSEREGFGGTPTITFQVSRKGRTDHHLLVFYHIGGSATNGEDYERIPTMVTIPAGYEAAEIVVHPIDDAIPERPESVVLSLVLPPATDPGLATPPPYFVGRAGRAGALIIDNDMPRPPCLRLADGTFHVCRPGDGSHCFRIEASGDMREWEALTDQSVSDGALHYVDPDGPIHDRRFYRVIPIPCPEH